MARDEMDDDLAHGPHPTTEALQRFADGAVDAADDRSLIKHIASCATCRDEVEQVRRVNASIALSSRPPADRFSRLKARRDAGERVALPVPEPVAAADDRAGESNLSPTEHPDLVDLHRLADGEIDSESDRAVIDHVAACEACTTEVELARRGAAIIALASRAPDVGFERLKARRNNGDRVLLPAPAQRVVPPVMRMATPAPPWIETSRKRRRGYAWASAVAASLVLAIGIRALTAPNEPGRTVVAVRDSTRSGTDSSLGFLPSVDSATRTAPIDSAAWVRMSIPLRRDLLRVQIASTELTPVRGSDYAVTIGVVESAFAGTALSSTATAALREIGVVASNPTYRVVIRPHIDSAATPGLSPRDADRVRSVAAALIAGGVDRRQLRSALPVRRRPDGSVISIEVGPAILGEPVRQRP